MMHQSSVHLSQYLHNYSFSLGYRDCCQWISVAVEGEILSSKHPSVGTRIGNGDIPSVCTKMTLAQRLPHNLEEQTVKFHRFVIAAHQRHQYSLARIYNMDETPMRFELPSSRTLEFSGSRTVPVKSSGAKKRCFTVTLAVAADGKKLPPAVTFKGVRTPRDLVVPDMVWVSFHKKGWMDEPGKFLYA